MIKIKTNPFFNEILVKFTYLVGMIADQNFYDIIFTFFYPMASATAEGWRLKFVRAKHLAMAKGENCTYGPTLQIGSKWIKLDKNGFLTSSSRSSSFSSSSSLPSDSGVVSLEVDSDEDSTEIF